MTYTKWHTQWNIATQNDTQKWHTQWYTQWHTQWQKQYHTEGHIQNDTHTMTHTRLSSTNKNAQRYKAYITYENSGTPKEQKNHTKTPFTMALKIPNIHK